jgi:hypothetical protein
MTQLSLAIPEVIARSRMPAEPIIRDAEIEDGYRWTLKRAWGPGPCIMWCGLNPSRANALRDDPTMLREIGFSYRWGFGSLIKVNIFPLITPSPRELHQWLRQANREPPVMSGIWPYSKQPIAAIMRNHQAVRMAIKQSALCVAAWGNHADPEEVGFFLDEATLQTDADGDTGDPAISIPVEWKCLGINDDGSPRHTLARGKNRIPDDAKLMPWSAP